MLIGHYISKLTEKSRTALPARFRREIGPNAIVAKWYEGCLVIVGIDSWSELLNKITGKTEFVTEPVRDTDRFILGSAFEINLDPQGRFVVPKVLKDYANLGDEIVFVGLGNRVEVWNKAEWEKRDKYVQEHAGGMMETLAQTSKSEK